MLGDRSCLRIEGAHPHRHHLSLWKAGLICSKFGPADSFAKICYLIFQNSICKFTIYYYNLSMISPMRHPIKIMTVTDGSP